MDAWLTPWVSLSSGARMCTGPTAPEQAPMRSCVVALGHVQDVMGSTARHFECSGKPSATAMLLMKKLANGEPLGDLASKVQVDEPTAGP